eukprot:g70423.t1
MIFLFLFLNESVNIKRLSISSFLLFPLSEVEDQLMLLCSAAGSAPAECLQAKRRTTRMMGRRMRRMRRRRRKEKGEVQREGVAGDSRDGQHPHSPVQHVQQMEDDKEEECVAATHDQNATVHALDASQQQLQEHTVIDEQPRNVVDGELGAGEELPGLDTFIVFELVDYDGDRKKRVRSKLRKKKVKKFSLGKVTKVDIDGDDPNVDSLVLINVWGKTINQVQTSIRGSIYRLGESEMSSLHIASTDQEHIKKDLRLYNCT